MKLASVKECRPKLFIQSVQVPSLRILAYFVKGYGYVTAEFGNF